MPGELSFSFVPEYSAVYLHASAPSDGRRVPISIRISDTAGLRAVLDKLEALMHAEAAKRRTARNPTNGLVHQTESTISVLVSGGSIAISRPLYEEAAALVIDGKALLAASLLSKSISWLGVAGARELVHAIYERQRAGGLRE